LLVTEEQEVAVEVLETSQSAVSLRMRQEGFAAAVLVVVVAVLGERGTDEHFLEAKAPSRSEESVLGARGLMYVLGDVQPEVHP